MQAILVIIHVVLCILNQLEGSTTQLWYETRMSEKIVPVYKQAFETLQHSILDPLLANVDQDNETVINQLFFDLTCSIQGMYHDLNFAVNESKTLYQEVDQKLVDIVAAISAKEGQVYRKRGEMQQKAAEIQGAQSGLVLAERSLWDKQQGLADAENALRIAEEKVEKARRCFGRRRRKRFLRFLKRVWRKFIVEPICAVINMSGIHIAKAVRNAANEQLEYTRYQFREKQQQLSRLQSQKWSLDTQLVQLQRDLETLNTEFMSLKDESNSTTIINRQLKLVTNHLTNVWDSSTVLYTTIRNLINFELLIIPLNAIYTELEHNHFLIGTSIHPIHQIQLEQAKASLDNLAGVLPQMPFITAIEILNCDANRSNTIAF